MNSRSLPPLVLPMLLVAACGCSSQPEEEPMPEPGDLTPLREQELEPVDFEIADMGDQAGLSAPLATVVRDAQAWHDVWGTRARTQVGELPAPEVDWERQMLALVTIGEQVSAGYGIAVLAVERSGGFLRVRVQKKEPPPDRMQAQVVTHPYVILRLPRFEGPVIFVIE